MVQDTDLYRVLCELKKKIINLLHREDFYKDNKWSKDSHVKME